MLITSLPGYPDHPPAVALSASSTVKSLFFPIHIHTVPLRRCSHAQSTLREQGFTSASLRLEHLYTLLGILLHRRLDLVRLGGNLYIIPRSE